MGAEAQRSSAGRLGMALLCHQVALLAGGDDLVGGGAHDLAPQRVAGKGELHLLNGHARGFCRQAEGRRAGR